MSGFLNRLFGGGKKEQHHFCSAVIAAAGSSVRMGLDKIYEPIGDMPVLAYTLRAFQNSEYIDEIVIVTKSESIAAAAGICKEYDITKASKVICGGASRMESVFKGLLEVSPEAELIAIHDGARPLVERRLIEETVKAALEHNAAAPAVPVKDTIKVAENGIVKETPDRKSLFAVQTPQIFEVSVIKAALQNVIDKGLEVTDDCSAVEQLGIPVYLTKGSERNIKITTPVDLLLADFLMSRDGEQAD